MSQYTQRINRFVFDMDKNTRTYLFPLLQTQLMMHWRRERKIV